MLNISAIISSTSSSIIYFILSLSIYLIIFHHIYLSCYLMLPSWSKTGPQALNYVILNLIYRYMYMWRGSNISVLFGGGGGEQVVI